jgi:hypothetical protein
MLNGEPVYQVMQKPFADLTTEQAMAVELIHGAGGDVLGYTLPSLKVRHQFLYSLGKNLGLWIDELVKQNQQQLSRLRHGRYQSKSFPLLCPVARLAATIA